MTKLLDEILSILKKEKSSKCASKLGPSEYHHYLPYMLPMRYFDSLVSSEIDRISDLVERFSSSLTSNQSTSSKEAEYAQPAFGFLESLFREHSLDVKIEREFQFSLFLVVDGQDKHIHGKVDKAILHNGLPIGVNEDKRVDDSMQLDSYPFLVQVCVEIDYAFSRFKDYVTNVPQKFAGILSNGEALVLVIRYVSFKGSVTWYQSPLVRDTGDKCKVLTAFMNIMRDLTSAMQN